jgi:two-component system NarL family sensor kinase
VEIAEGLDFEFLSSEQRLHLYRIAQEALNNIGKHSGAKQAMLIARFGDGKPEPLLFSVSDDGVGLPKSFDGSSHSNDAHKLGMRIMRQRAMLMGAEINFISEAGNGLMVCIEIPAQEAAQ